MVLAFLLTATTLLQSLTGVVTDPSGGVVSGAVVVVRSATGGEQQVQTGPDGRFTVDAPDGAVTLIVRAGGFAEARQSVAATVTTPVDVVLQPAAVLESVTVTPTRSAQTLADTPASVSVLSREQIRESPAVVADDVLRQIPTFSLFRRTSSLSSNPTAQGVSLRGIGPSGVSRTLVLTDNVPVNDPFGGWVYWTRVPLENVDRVEVVEGPSSSLYGNYAMGGVINITTGRPVRRTLELKPQFGNLGTRKGDLFASDVVGRLAASVNGSVFDTNGFPVVAVGERGPIDTNASVTYRNANAKLDYTATDRVSTYLRVGYFKEERNNAKVTTFAPTVAEGNDTVWKALNGGIRVQAPWASTLEVTGFYDDVRFHSNFIAVPNLVTRATARLTLDQVVPTNNAGGAAVWSRAFGTRHFVTAGADTRWVQGESQENGFDATTGLTQTLRRLSGGTQRSAGAFVQDIFTPVDRLTVTASLRVDRWRNYDAHNLENSVAGGVIGAATANNKPTLPDRTDQVGSPKLAAVYHLTPAVNVWASVSGGFRAPTLNELYRQYRVGAILTLANENLGPERLTATEAGVSATLMRRLTVRSTFFDNRIKNPVSNVTIATNTQQRQNLGRTRVRGVQADLEYRIGTQWRVTGGYLFNDATVVEFAANPALVNNCQGIAGAACTLAQVPRHRGSIQASYSEPRIATVSLGVQVLGLQYDDDLNVRGVPASGCAANAAACAAPGTPGLPGYTLVDLNASRALGRHVEFFVGAQNVANRTYYVSTNPTTIGSPRMVNGGVRVRFSGR